MSRRLILGMNVRLIDPSKRDLLSISNMICRTDTSSLLKFDYTIIDNDLTVHKNHINGKLNNLKLTYHMSIFGYEKIDTDLSKVINELV